MRSREFHPHLETLFLDRSFFPTGVPSPFSISIQTFLRPVFYSRVVIAPEQFPAAFSKILVFFHGKVARRKVTCPSCRLSLLFPLGLQLLSSVSTSEREHASWKSNQDFAIRPGLALVSGWNLWLLNFWISLVQRSIDRIHWYRREDWSTVGKHTGKIVRTAAYTWLSFRRLFLVRPISANGVHHLARIFARGDIALFLARGRYTLTTFFRNVEQRYTSNFLYAWHLRMRATAT